MITAPRLFLVAREAYEQLISAHSRPKGVSVGLTAIVFATVSLEALINEVTELAALEIAEQENSDPELLSFVEVIDEIERSRGSTRLKFLLASSVLGGATYEKGSNPYQDYALLTSLRDALVHLKPTKLMAEEGKTRIGVEGVFKELQSRGLVSSLPPNQIAPLVDLVATPRVAHWALSAASAMALSFISMFPDGFRSILVEDYAESFSVGGAPKVH